MLASHDPQIAAGSDGLIRPGSVAAADDINITDGCPVDDSSSSSTLWPPADSPRMVTSAGLPPKARTLRCTHHSAASAIRCVGQRG